MSRIGMLSIALAVVAASCGGATSDDAPTTSPATEPETSVTTTSAAPTTTAVVAAAVGDTEFCDKIVRERSNRPWQLFNLKDDLSESKNLADAHPEKVDELKAAFAAWDRTVR